VIALDRGSAGLAVAMAETACVPAVTLEKRRGPAGVKHIALTEESRDILAAAGSALVVDDLLVSGGSLSSATSEIARSGIIGNLDAFVWHMRANSSDFPRVAQLLKSGLIGSLMTSNLVPGVPGVTAIPADLLLAGILDGR
jgi:phosphoribosylpyrophosphate synthetase